MEGFAYKSYRSRFVELKDEIHVLVRDGKDCSDKIDQVKHIEIVASQYRDGIVLRREIEDWLEQWLRGDRTYDSDEYITRQELERITKSDCYYFNIDYTQRSFLNTSTIPTIYTPEELIDNWIANGLHCLEACPWSRPPRYDYDHEKDCKDNQNNTLAIKIVNIRNFLSQHNLPVPTAIFPNDANNTSYTLDRLNTAYTNLTKKRKEEREYLELNKLRRENETSAPLLTASTGSASIAVIQDAPEVGGQGSTATAQGPKHHPGGPTQKELLAEAERILALKGYDRLEGNDRRHVQAFVYRAKKLPLDRVYESLAVGLKDKPSKKKVTQKGNYHMWARKGEKICRDRLS